MSYSMYICHDSFLWIPDNQVLLVPAKYGLKKKNQVTGDTHLSPRGELHHLTLPRVNPENFQLRTKAGKHGALPDSQPSRSQRNSTAEGSQTKSP